MKETLVIGAGWLGRQLIEILTENGHIVSVSSRSPEKLDTFSRVKEKILVSIQDGKYLFSKDISHFNQVIICLPPIDNYPDIIQSILSSISKDANLIFMSSIGLYEKISGNLDEEAQIQEAHILWRVEKLIMQRSSYVILRLGGLIGPGRHPVTHMLNKIDLAGGNQLVNLIHSWDICSLILLLQEKNIMRVTYNLVFPFHPSRAEYYSMAAEELYGKKLLFKSEPFEKRRVDGSKIVDDLNFCYATQPDNWQSIKQKEQH
ncbi:MAG: hypothetical protein FJY17_00445 [Bacteroidetes bacterium]|nr:hypothetical protein [Bacteroidota bacterium]